MCSILRQVYSLAPPSHSTRVVAQSSSRARELFTLPDYLRLWLIGAGVGIGRWLEFLALGIFAYQVTGSPSLVAAVAIVRMLPYVFCGFIVGALADYLDKKRMLALTFLGGSTAFAVMAGLAAADMAGYGTVLVAAIVAGLMWTTDMPVRRRLLVDAAGIERMTAALGFDNSTHYATRAIGPIAGGAAYQLFGIDGIFLLSAGIYAACFYLTTRLNVREAAVSGTEGETRPSLLELLLPPKELLRSRRFQVVLGVTIVYNIWCFPIISMVPVLGEEQFRLSPALIGALSATEGIGGTIGAILIGLWAGNTPLFRLYYFGIFAFSILLLTLSAWLTLGMAVVCLLLIGASAACFSATQYALIYTMAPPKMRGRAAGFLSIFIGTSTIGFYNTGLLFSWFDAADALMLMGGQGLIVTVILGMFWVRAKS